MKLPSNSLLLQCTDKVQIGFHLYNCIHQLEKLQLELEAVAHKWKKAVSEKSENEKFNFYRKEVKANTAIISQLKKHLEGQWELLDTTPSGNTNLILVIAGEVNTLIDKSRKMMKVTRRLMSSWDVKQGQPAVSYLAKAA